MTQIPERHEYVDYELLSFELTDLLIWVWCVVENGRTVLRCAPVQAVGLARETYHVLSGVSKPTETDISNEIVGLVLRDGEWEVVNYYEHYCGLCFKDDDFATATHHMKLKFVQTFDPENPT